jgi:hypothetical protein
MTKWIAAALGALVFASLMQLGCKDEMVGAPCIPETDKGDFSATLSGTTWSIETRSVQCMTRLCLTKTEPNPYAAAQADACQAAAPGDQMAECWQGAGGTVQAKYSFCSCRCKDINGHTYNKNSNTNSNLCQCPPNTKCVEVLGDIEEAPNMVKGSYCVPNCIASGECYSNVNGDGTNYTCMPSKDSKKPWQWKCTEFDPSN